MSHPPSLPLLQTVSEAGWVAPSFVALVVAIVIWWLAYTTKGKLQD